MKPSTVRCEELAAAVVEAACQELDAAVFKIKHCLNQLNDEQIWWRPTESMNSIANLLLHLSGNLGQWIIAGLGGRDDSRDRPAEFAARGPVSRFELLERLDSVIADAKKVLSGLDAHDLTRKYRIQGFEVTGMGAVFDSIPHFRGHTQEIVHLTRCLLGETYVFDFVPRTLEQGL